jgi:hypothetical protein
MTFRDPSTYPGSSCFWHPRYENDPDYLDTEIDFANDDSHTPYFKHFFERKPTEYERVPIAPATTEGSGLVKSFLTGAALATAGWWYFRTGGCPSASAFSAAFEPLPGGSTFSPADSRGGWSLMPSVKTVVGCGIGSAFLSKVVEQVQKGLVEKSTVGKTAGESTALSEGGKLQKKRKAKWQRFEGGFRTVLFVAYCRCICSSSHSWRAMGIPKLLPRTTYGYVSPH